jgi:hypothetical protein
MWLRLGIGGTVIDRKEVPTAETLRVSGPTFWTSSVRILRVRSPITEGLPEISFFSCIEAEYLIKMSKGKGKAL